MTLRLRTGQGESRFAVVVSSAVSRNATSRNYLRRVLYGALRFHWPKLKKGLNGAIFLKKHAVNLRPNELKEELKDLLNVSRSLTP